MLQKMRYSENKEDNNKECNVSTNFNSINKNNIYTLCIVICMPNIDYSCIKVKIIKKNAKKLKIKWT